MPIRILHVLESLVAGGIGIAVFPDDGREAETLLLPGRVVCPEAVPEQASKIRLIGGALAAIASRDPQGLLHEQAIRETVRWYVAHEWWWRKIKSGEFKEYYRRLYGERKLIAAA